MAGKVIFEVTRGELEGKKYEYENPDRVFIGRQEDCGIVLPENTVSRYHCLLDINPPQVKLQDFGSLNGTFLNDEKIGQRERDQSWEEARSEEHDEYELHDGDRIRLGKRCELTCSVVEAEQVKEDGTLAEEEPPVPAGTEMPVISEIIEPAAEPEKEAEEPAGQAAEPEEAAVPEEPEEDEESGYLSVSQGEQKVCGACGNMFPPSSPDDTLCPECRQDRDKMLGAILAALIGGAMEEKPSGPSPVKGFDKIALLGKGGMGEVWKVKEQKTGKFYALKTMLPKVAGNENAKAMFLREAKLSEFLHHKNVVNTYQTGCSDGTFFILMDLCEGGCVDDLLKLHGGKLPLGLATYIMLQVLEGLDYVHHVDVETEIKKRGIFGTRKVLHAKGLVHRDFKPGNIFLSDKGDHPVAKVADFGMAKAFQTAGFTDMSSAEMVKGTVPFMPRQQALDCRYAKPEVDVWAAAASYYHMLTGAFPKNFRPGGNVWRSLVTEKAVPIRERDASIPEKIALVIDHALLESPQIGCKSAAVLRDDLILALPGETKDYCRGLL